MKNAEQWLLETYQVEEGEYLLIIADPKDEDYKLKHKKNRFGYEETLGEGYDHPEDAEQVAIGMLSQAGQENVVDEVLEQ